MVKKLLKESGNLNRSPEESAKVASKTMNLSLDGTPISKKIEKIVDDILAGNTKKYHNSSLAKDKKLSENTDLTEKEVLDEPLKTEGENEIQKTVTEMEKEDEIEENTNDGNFPVEMEEDDELTLDDISFEDEPEVATSEEPKEEAEDIDLSITDDPAGTTKENENEFESLPDFKPEMEETPDIPNFTEKEKEKVKAEPEPEPEPEMPEFPADGEETEEKPEETEEKPKEEMEGNFSANIPESEVTDDELKTQVDEYETEACEIKEKVAKMMEKIDNEIMDEALKESLVIMFEMYASAKAKAMAVKKANTILNKMDGYMRGVVKEFVEVNSQKINESINASKKIELFESINHSINKIYGENSFEDSYKTENVLTNVIALQKKQNDSLKKQISEAKMKNEQLQAKLYFMAETKDLTDLERVRLSKLVESFGSFKGLEDFTKKFKVLKENFTAKPLSESKKASPKKFESLNENNIEKTLKSKEVITEGNKVDVSKYAKFLG